MYWKKVISLTGGINESEIRKNYMHWMSNPRHITKYSLIVLLNVTAKKHHSCTQYTIPYYSMHSDGMRAILSHACDITWIFIFLFFRLNFKTANKRNVLYNEIQFLDKMLFIRALKSIWKVVESNSMKF